MPIIFMLCFQCIANDALSIRDHRRIRYACVRNNSIAPVDRATAAKPRRRASIADVKRRR
jgi:hypothetical protein